MILGTKMALTSQFNQIGNQTNPPLLIFRNKFYRETFLNDCSGKVTGVPLSNLLYISDILPGVGVGLPRHNVDQQPDLLAWALKEAL